MAYIRQLKGSWVAAIRRKGHKSISKSFPTKGRAVEWARGVEAQMDARQFKDARGLSDITFGQLIERYTEEIGGIKPFGRCKADVLRRLAIHLGHVAMSEMTTDRIMDYVRPRAKEVSGVTLAVEITYMAVVLRAAKELWDLPVDTSVTGAVRSKLKFLGVSTKSIERDRRPTQREIDDICLYFTTKVRQKVPMEDLILFAIETAMRLGEILALRWEDINHADKTITIRNRKHPTEKQGNDQEVPLLGDAYKIACRQPKIDDRIFPYADGTPSTLFPRACKALKIDDLRFHDLRHEGVSRLFERGYTIEQVSLISGHRDWKMLARYVQLRAKDLHRICG
jgi:integrase